LVKISPQDYAKHFVFITDPKKGVLLKIAKKEGIPFFPVPEKVGGRFSVLSCVGLLPAALAGVDAGSIMKGALEMVKSINKTEADKNPALLLAALQYIMDRKKSRSMTIVMPYSNYLYRFSDWYRQLLAESIGKNKKTGPTPVSALGTTDQHSQLQLYNEGPENKFIIFMRVLKHKSDLMNGSKMPKEMAFLNSKEMGFVLDASYKGTAESLAHNKRPNITIEIPELNAKNLGALFMLFEFQMALLGLLYKVDAFNQPGVEHSKILTKQILSQTK
jgi:glucose-6-phosphate isomerase